VYDRCHRKIYVGSTKNLKRRITDHFRLKGKPTQKLYRAIKKYGKENFSIFILEYCEYLKTLDSEQKWLDYYKPFKNIGYNICKQAHKTIGYKHTNKTRKLLKEYAKKRDFSGCNNPTFGTKRPKHVKDAVSKANKGKRTHSKQVAQIDPKTMEVIRIWDCTYDAARALHIDYSTIRDCCRGTPTKLRYGKPALKLAKGWHFRRTTNEEIVNRVNCPIFD